MVEGIEYIPSAAQVHQCAVLLHVLATTGQAEFECMTLVRLVESGFRGSGFGFLGDAFCMGMS